MIVYQDKSFETRSDKPNENWTDNEDVYVVDDNSELAQRIINAYPHYDFVDKNGELVDIIELEKPPQPPPEPTEIELLQQENQLLKAQNQALQDKADFHEDILTEIILELHS